MRCCCPSAMSLASKSAGALRRSAFGVEEDDEHHDQDYDHKQSDLDPALRIFSRERARHAVCDDAVGRAAILVIQKPDGQEDVFESLCAVVSSDFEVAMCVARNLRGAKLAQ